MNIIFDTSTNIVRFNAKVLFGSEPTKLIKYINGAYLPNRLQEYISNICHLNGTRFHPDKDEIVLVHLYTEDTKDGYDLFDTGIKFYDDDNTCRLILLDHYLPAKIFGSDVSYDEYGYTIIKLPMFISVYNSNTHEYTLVNRIVAEIKITEFVQK